MSGHLHARAELVGLGPGGEDADLAFLQVFGDDWRQRGERPRRDLLEHEPAVRRAEELDFVRQRVADLGAGFIGDERHALVRLNGEADANRIAGAGEQILINECSSRHVSKANLGLVYHALDDGLDVVARGFIGPKLAVGARTMVENPADVLDFVPAVQLVQHVVHELQILENQVPLRHLGLTAEVDQLPIDPVARRAPLVLHEEGPCRTGASSDSSGGADAA